MAKKKKLKASITTPHYWKTNPYFEELYDSLLEQTIDDWELVVLLSHGGKVSDRVKKDKRVKILEDTGEDNNIGRLKRICNDAASNDILIEVDADDMLTPTAIEDILKAFEDKSAHFVYSNSAAFYDGTWEPMTYSSYWGWSSRPFTWKGYNLREQISFPPSATALWRIEWAPNHVRSWRKSSYEKVGGHDPSIANGDDHELMCRFYLEYGDKGFKWIDKCLYLYRLHNNNHCVVDNSTVQDTVLKNYFKYSRPIAIKWAKDHNLKLIDVSKEAEDWELFEKVSLEDIDKLKNDSVGVLKLHNTIQESDEPIKTMGKIWDKLCHGGILFLEVPSTECNDALANPLNKSYWNSESSKYYTRKRYAEKIGFKGKFQEWRNATFYPTNWHKDERWLITQVDMVAIKKNKPTLPGPQWM